MTTGNNRMSRRSLCALISLLLLAQVVTAQTPPSAEKAPLPGDKKTVSVQTPPLTETGRPGTIQQQPASTIPQRPIQLSSSQFIAPLGLSVEQLVDSGFRLRADLLAARQRLAIAQGRLVQAGLRPNPTLESEYGTPRFLGGEFELTSSVGISQVFEMGGKRTKRVAVARLELAQTRSEVLALERQFAAGVRASYARAIAAGRQLDALDRLIAANEELVRVTNERLNQGDVAPLEVNLVRVETDRLRAQVIRTRAELEGEIISLRALVGLDINEPLRIAPLPERPPRLDISVAELTDIALRERPDLQAARLAEELGTARIRLAEAQRTPNIAGSARFVRDRQIVDLPQRLGSGSIPNTDNSLVFGLAVDLPIFNRNQGEIASAVGERVQAQRQREFLEATIKRDIALAYRRYRAAAEAVVLYATQIIPNSEKNLQSVRAAYGLGEFSVFDVVNEQRRLIESETGYNEALRDYYSALAELERALGTTLPPSGFAPFPITVLPDSHGIDVPGLLRSLKSSGLRVQPTSKPEGLLVPPAATQH
ncbi:MAG: TolC family protein [Pyrinomonadaceae bacterium]